MTQHYKKMFRKCFDPDFDFESFRTKFTQKESLPFKRSYITLVNIDKVTIEVNPELDS